MLPRFFNTNTNNKTLMLILNHTNTDTNLHTNTHEYQKIPISLPILKVFWYWLSTKFAIFQKGEKCPPVLIRFNHLIVHIDILLDVAYNFEKSDNFFSQILNY